jgi:hypothetical protein
VSQALFEESGIGVQIQPRPICLGTESPIRHRAGYVGRAKNPLGEFKIGLLKCRDPQYPAFRSDNR